MTHSNYTSAPCQFTVTEDSGNLISQSANLHAIELERSVIHHRSSPHSLPYQSSRLISYSILAQLQELNKTKSTAPHVSSWQGDLPCPCSDLEFTTIAAIETNNAQKRPWKPVADSLWLTSQKGASFNKVVKRYQFVPRLAHCPVIRGSKPSRHPARFFVSSEISAVTSFLNCGHTSP